MALKMQRDILLLYEDVKSVTIHPLENDNGYEIKVEVKENGCKNQKHIEESRKENQG